jgi:hypothetical protein
MFEDRAVKVEGLTGTIIEPEERGDRGHGLTLMIVGPDFEGRGLLARTGDSQPLAIRVR